jgi:hypothetical protein
LLLLTSDAAEQMYIVLISDKRAVGYPLWDHRIADPISLLGEEQTFACSFARNAIDLAKAVEIVSTTVWDGTAEVSKRSRSQLFHLFGIAEAKNSREAEGAKHLAPLKMRQKEDELNSYTALVRDAGY